MTQSVNPSLAMALQDITDDYKRNKLFELLTALFGKSIEKLQIINKKDKQKRILLTLNQENTFKVDSENLTVPRTIYFNVQEGGILDFDHEFYAPVMDNCFWNEVKVEGDSYHFIRNGVTFDFSAPLEKTISIATLLKSLNP